MSASATASVPSPIASPASGAPASASGAPGAAGVAVLGRIVGAGRAVGADAIPEYPFSLRMAEGGAIESLTLHEPPAAEAAHDDGLLGELIAVAVAVVAVTLVVPHWATMAASGLALLALAGTVGRRLRTRPPLRSPNVSSLPSDFASFFRLAGMLAASDGRIRRTEIELADAFIASLQADASFRWDALTEFARGCQCPTQVDLEARHLAHLLQNDRDWAETFVATLCELAQATGCIAPPQARLLHTVAAAVLGPGGQIERFLAGACQNDPHCLLGVAYDARPEAIEATYRTKMQIFHADRLAAAGYPIEVQSLARHQLRKLRGAYETLTA